MREKEPQFTVTDRRKFTAEGELREGEAKASESSPRRLLLSEQAGREPAAGGPTQVCKLSLDEPVGDGRRRNHPRAHRGRIRAAEQEYHASARRLDDMVQKANPGQPAPRDELRSPGAVPLHDRGGADGRRHRSQRAAAHRHSGGTAKH
jgi:hypothetical protein